MPNEPSGAWNRTPRVARARSEPPRAPRPSALLLLVSFMVVLGAPRGAWTQQDRAELLLPGVEYHEAALPSHADDTWWVLHQPTGATVLVALRVVVTPVESYTGGLSQHMNRHTVNVPPARDPILLVRGLPDLTAGPVHTVFLDGRGYDKPEQVEASWGDQRLIVRHVVDLPVGDQFGRHRIELTLGDRQLGLHNDDWGGDGHWGVWWIGDLNRDGWPDVLLDASYKYSVYATRLYLSRYRDGRLELIEAARLERTAC